MFTNDSRDDEPHSQLAAGFEGVDTTTPAALLPPGMLSEGRNIICTGNGRADSRPGLRLVSYLSGTLGGGAAAYYQYPRCRGLCYYDLPDYEGLMVHHDEKLIAIPSVANAATPACVLVPGSYQTAPIDTVQLLDTLFYLVDGQLMWAKNTAGVWTNGLVLLFSDGSAMPLWSKLVCQNFRLMLLEPNGYKLYTSAIGAASVAANWVKTDNIQVGNGNGDPARGLVANQGGYITMLNSQSVYQINMSSATVASWTSERVTAATGCVEGHTAVAFGQDIFFLARQGVVSLGSLADTISLSPAATLSAPIQSYIDRINWTYISTAFATSWREYYLLAVPLDSDVLPKHILAYHTRLKRWMPLWEFATSYTQSQPVGSTTWTGFTCAGTANFGDKSETVFADNAGRVLRLDDSTNLDEFIIATPDYFKSWMVTKSFEHDAMDALKHPLMVEIEQVDAVTTQAVVAHLPDETSPVTDAYPIGGWNTYGLGDYNPASGVDRTRYNLRGRTAHRSARVQIYSYNSAGGLRVRAVKNTSFVNPSQLTT